MTFQLVGSTVNIPALKLSDLLPTNTAKFYRYPGSLTTPHCDESVMWTVFSDPIKVSSAQVNSMSVTIVVSGVASAVGEFCITTRLHDWVKNLPGLFPSITLLFLASLQLLSLINSSLIDSLDCLSAGFCSDNFGFVFTTLTGKTSIKYCCYHFS